MSARTSALIPRLLATLLCLSAIPVRHSTACSCPPPPPPVAALVESDAVFEGVVEAIESKQPQAGDESDSSHAEVLHVRFRVLRAWKGTEAGEVVVDTSAFSGSCGYHFERGLRYLVYATRGAKSLSTGACSRTKRASDAHGDFRQLGTARWEAKP